MEQNDMRYQRKKDSRVWNGLVLLAVGVLLLAYKMGAPIPNWIFTWPVLLIAMGFLTGIKSRFHNPGAFIMMIVGGVFLIDKTVPGINFHDYILPAILIGIGLVFIFRPRHRDHRLGRAWEDRQQSYQPNNVTVENNLKPANSAVTGDDEEYIEINAVFGGVKKMILSKNFKGGELNSFMGGSELNLMQADILQPVVLEVHNVFGGTKLILPANWDVRNEVTAIFGGIDDKRSMNTGTPDANKIIILKGACIFGGIEVANY